MQYCVKHFYKCCTTSHVFNTNMATKGFRLYLRADYGLFFEQVLRNRNPNMITTKCSQFDGHDLSNWVKATK